MPLPWLIGAAVVAAGAAVVSALSDDNKPSNNSNNDNEERRRRAAESERKKRERDEKKISIKKEFDQGVQRTYQEIISSLPSLVTIHGTKINNLTLSSKGSNFTQLKSELVKKVKYQFLTEISLFEKIYGIDVKPTDEMKKMIKDVDLLQEELNKLTLAIKTFS